MELTAVCGLATRASLRLGWHCQEPAPHSLAVKAILKRRHFSKHSHIAKCPTCALIFKEAVAGDGVDRLAHSRRKCLVFRFEGLALGI
jgi:hypothetical protein